jgi:hypothetical protein
VDSSVDTIFIGPKQYLLSRTVEGRSHGDTGGQNQLQPKQDGSRQCTRSGGNRWIGQVGELFGVLPRPELTVANAESVNC